MVIGDIVVRKSYDKVVTFKINNNKFYLEINWAANMKYNV